VLQKSQVQLRSAAVQPPPAKRGCKPASHHEPSMIVHLPSNAALTSSPFISPPPRQYIALAHSRSRDTGVTTAAAAAATLGPTSDLLSSPSYRPADSNVIAYRATLAHESEPRRDISSSVEADRPLHEIGDVLTKPEPASTRCEGKQVKSAVSVSSHHGDGRPATSLTQRPSDSAFVAGKMASQVSHAKRVN